MANILCPTKIDCACDDNPFANLSAEAPDKRLFFSTAFVQLLPPLGTAWGQTFCSSVCESSTSQQAADLCATLQAEECVVSTWTSGGTAAPPAPPPSEPQGNMQSPFFLNSPQDGTVFCPDGLPFTFTVPAGLFGDTSQGGADAKAQSLAVQLAGSHVICLGNITTQTCSGAPYNSTIVATGAFLATPPQGDFWDLVAGALPPGLTMPTGFITGGQNTISGTPTTPGSYTFTVSIIDPSGDFQQKPYTISVAGIINSNPFPEGSSGAAYNQNVDSVGVTNPIFSLEAGSLPDGLSLDSGGIIFGTPTATGTFNFVLGVTEAGTGLTCEASGSITIGGTCVQPVIKYSTAFPHSAITGANTVTAYRIGPGHYTFVTNNADVGAGTSLALSDVNGAVLLSGAGTAPPGGGQVAVYYPPNDNFYCYSTNQSMSWSGATCTQIDGQAVGFGQNFTWDAIYNPVNSLVYLNANTDLVVFNPAVNYTAPLADITTGTINVFFAGKLSLDTANKRLFSAFDDLTLAVWTGSVVIYDISGVVPVLLHRYFIPAVGAGGVLLNSVMFVPGSNKIYVIGSEQDGGHGDQRDFVIVMDASTGAVIANLTTPDPIGGIGTFGLIANPVLNPVANLLYIPGSGSIMVLCTNTDTFLTSLPVVTECLNGVFVSFNNTVSYTSSGGVFQSIISNFGPP